MKRNKRAGVAGGKKERTGRVFGQTAISFLPNRMEGEVDPTVGRRGARRRTRARRWPGGGGNREVAEGVLLPSSPWVGTVGGGGSMGGDRL
jgi:hypothetical protein